MLKTARRKNGAKGAVMRIGSWSRILLAAAPVLACFLTGCGDFWQAPSTTSTTGFTLTNSGNIAVAPGATSGDVTITVTPGSSFTGTVTLSCAFGTVPAGATSSNEPTCNFSSSSLTFSSTTVQTSTFTATTASGTPLGAYDITINGVSGSVAASTSFCVEVAASGTGTCTSTATTSGNFYILNGGTSGQIAGFTISSNKLTAISGGSQVVSSATAVAMAPSGNFLYVASLSDGITIYPITSTGALQAGVNFNGDKQAAALEVDPSGKWLLDASASGTLTAYPITSTGTLDSTRTSQSQPLAIAAVVPGGIAISPNGAFIAVALGSTGTQIFTFGSETLGAGTIVYGPTNKSAGSAVSVAMDPQSLFMYIGEVDAFPSDPNSHPGGLRVFSISGTSLTELTPSSSGGVSPNFILPIASGKYVYVANGMGGTAAGNITGFAVSSSGISAGTTVAAGAQPFGLAEDSTDSWVFEVGSTGSPYFDAYTFDATTTGQLDSQVTSTAAATSIAIVAAPK